MKAIIDYTENEDMLILAERFEVLKVMDGKAVAEHSSLDAMIDDGSPSCSCASSVSYSSIADDSESLNNNQSLVNSNISSTATANDNILTRAASITRDPLAFVQKSLPKQSVLPLFTPPKASPFDVGRLINKEMLKFDHLERNAINEEVHGVDCLCPDESEPGMVETALRELDRELQIIPDKQKAAYLLSLRYPDSYVHQLDFKMRFLRFELFDPQKAAFRMVLCLDNFLELFGEYALQRPIRVSDFSKKEYKVLAAGRIQVLPFRDRGGRRIFVGFPSRDHQFFDPRIRVSRFGTPNFDSIAVVCFVRSLLLLLLFYV